MKKIIKEINENKNLEVNLPQYGNFMMELYYKRAMVEFVMDYYTLTSMLSDEEKVGEHLQSVMNRFEHIIAHYVLTPKANEEREEGIKEIDALRNEVYRTVDILSTYTDIFSRYEHVSNRCEYLFKDYTEKIDDEALTKDVMNYIFSDEDNAAINSKISEVIAELPLRMTKNKFFELLSEGLGVYSKTDKETIDDFVYVLKTSSMLVLPEHMDEYSELYELFQEIKAIDFSNLTQEQFKKLEDSLYYVSDYIEKETNLYMLLQGLINRAYVAIIVGPYVLTTDKETDMCLEVIQAIHENMSEGDYVSLPDEVTDLFVFLEGVPEAVIQKIQNYEYTLDTVRNSYASIAKSLMLDKIYEGLFVCQSLLSDSLFIDLTKDFNAFEDTVLEEQQEFDAEAYVAKVRDEMITLLTKFFCENQKIVNRSVMSLILSRLPVFFNNITEVQDYVYNSISNCTNKAEKYAVTEILKAIIHEA